MPPISLNMPVTINLRDGAHQIPFQEGCVDRFANDSIRLQAAPVRVATQVRLALRAFTKSFAPLRMETRFAPSRGEFQFLLRNLNCLVITQAGTGVTLNMAATGELIRLINYVDDINTTLRRISASIAGMDVEERTRLGDSLRAAGSNLNGVLNHLEKGSL
jgi:hypothetical protein